MKFGSIDLLLMEIIPPNFHQNNSTIKGQKVLSGAWPAKGDTLNT